MHMDQEVNGEFINHDCENFYRDIDEPNPNNRKYSSKVKEATSKLFSDTSMSSLGDTLQLPSSPERHTEQHDKHQLTEAEITYLIEIYKKKNQKWCERAVLREVRKEAMYTAKMICKETVEGQNPLCHVLEKFCSEGLNGVRMLLYRCLKLHHIRHEATKILLMCIKLHFDISDGKRISERTADSNVVLWKRLKNLVTAFNAEHSPFLGPFLYNGGELEGICTLNITTYEKQTKRNPVEPARSTMQADQIQLKRMIKEQQIEDKKAARQNSCFDYVNQLAQRVQL